MLLLYFDNSHLVDNHIQKLQNKIMVEQSLKRIGNNIRSARKSKNLSQEKLAELVGVSRNYIGMIERAEANVPTKTLIEIAFALNVHPKIFFEY